MQQLSSIFPILIVVWVLLIAFKVGSHLDKKLKKEHKLEPPKKVCPLHDWAWEEQIGVEPPTFFIRCQRCRRLPGWGREV